MLIKHTVRLAALLISVLTMAACTRSEPEDAAAQDAAQTETVPQTARRRDGEPAVSMRLTDQGRQRSEIATVNPADPRDDAFEASRVLAVPVHPQDTTLGSLGGGSSNARDRAVRAAGRALLIALMDGELPVDSLSTQLGPGGRANLEDLMWAAEAFEAVRIGEVIPVTVSEVSLPFRMFGESREATGELIMVQADDQWYTADIQVEFSDRDTTIRFNPSGARSGGRN